MHHGAFQRAEEGRIGLDRHRADGASRHEEAEHVNGVGRIGNNDHVARGGDRLRHVGEAFFGAERGDDLRLRIELHAESARVISGLGAAQARYSPRRRIAVGTGAADGLLELLHNMRGRRQIGIAHAEVDDVGAAIAGDGLGAVDHLEYVRRQAADAVKLFHDLDRQVGLAIHMSLSTDCLITAWHRH